MELTVEERPKTAKFTASKSTRVVADNGGMCALFEAGQTINLHSDMWTAAIAAGLMPEDPLEFVEVVKPEEPSTHGKKLIEACKTLIIRASTDDFTIVGQPRAASVKKLVDFRFTTVEVKAAFEEAMHEVEQDGNDDTKHSEPSSSAAE